MFKEGDVVYCTFTQMHRLTYVTQMANGKYLISYKTDYATEYKAVDMVYTKPQWDERVRLNDIEKTKNWLVRLKEQTKEAKAQLKKLQGE